MDMKNRYLKNARIPERKVRELLILFCEDLTATQIANISGVSRVTVNAYLKLIRTQIAQYCEEHNPFYRNNGLIPFICNKHIVLNGHSVNHSNENHWYGILKTEQSVYTKSISNIDNLWLNSWVRGKINAESHSIEQNHLHIFEAIADFSRPKLFRVNNALYFTKGKSVIDEIDLFWGLLKSRIVKFRGLNSNNTYLHVKESEFRYNNRNADLFAIIHSLIQKQPLHYMRQRTVLS
jgi:transposase